MIIKLYSKNTKVATNSIECISWEFMYPFLMIHIDDKMIQAVHGDRLRGFDILKDAKVIKE